MEGTSAYCNAAEILSNKVEDFGGLSCAIGWMFLQWGDIVKALIFFANIVDGSSLEGYSKTRRVNIYGC